MIDELSPDEPQHFELTESGLVLRDAHGDQARYDLQVDSVAELAPRSGAGRWPTIDRQELKCGEVVITWNAWVEAWQRPREEPIAPPLDDCGVLMDARVPNASER